MASVRRAGGGRSFPANFVYRRPHLFVAIASYSGDLTYVQFRDSAAVSNWLTPQRGGCIAAGVAGTFTGKGYSYVIMDDPYKGSEDAGSPRARHRLIEWLRSLWFPTAVPQSIEAGDGARRRNLSALIVTLTHWDQGT